MKNLRGSTVIILLVSIVSNQSLSINQKFEHRDSTVLKFLFVFIQPFIFLYLEDINYSIYVYF